MNKDVRNKIILGVLLSVILYILDPGLSVALFATGFTIGAFISSFIDSSNHDDRYKDITPLYGGKVEKDSIAKQREEDAKRKGRMKNERWNNLSFVYLTYKYICGIM